MAPGTQRALQVVISDADVAYEQLVKAGVDPMPIDAQPWGRFVGFSDPDGNTWALQESPNRVNPPA
jgi:uncharacterized glyoxalase superfamily protein PhnB